MLGEAYIFPLVLCNGFLILCCMYPITTTINRIQNT